MRVLIVEDDAALGIFLAKGLKLEGHEVELVGDGRTGLARASEWRPELMVLDLNLPQMDGLQVLERLRPEAASVSVLVLTGRNGLEDRLNCLNLGAEDCLLKPFSFNELTARCRVLLRRREQFRDPVLRANGVELNRFERTVARHGRRVELTTKEFALLEYLMQAQGRVCLRTELLRDVWQATPAAGTNVVDVYVNYLRKKLGAVRLPVIDEEIGDRLIETVRGEGYVMATAPANRKAAASAPAAEWERGGQASA